MQSTIPTLFQSTQLAAVLGRVLSVAGDIDFPTALVNDATVALAQHQLALTQRYVLRDANHNEVQDEAVAVMAYDRITDLTWHLHSSAERYTHAEALEYVATLNTGGFTDWRLPNILELESPRDLTVFNPAVAAPFRKGVKPNFHWSSSLDPEDEVFARLVNFHYGYSGISRRHSTAFVLAVRGGAVVGALPGQ